MSPENILQERLQRMEAGEAPDPAWAGLPEAETDLLKTAAQLGAVPLPKPAAHRAAAQRADLLRAARDTSASPHSEPARVKPRGTLAALRALAQRLTSLPRPALALGAVAVVALLVFALAPSSPNGTPLASSDPSAPAADEPVYTQYLPSLANTRSAPNPHSAMLGETRGIVEVQTGNGWALASDGQVVQAGQRIRTGELSSATLLFYDRSQARLGAATEVSIDELDARTDGPRVVRLTQTVGESDHDVTPSKGAGSSYTVDTPTGIGAAKGTSFHVSVSPSFVTRIRVDEGVVAVTNLNVTVLVDAGQVTTVHNGKPPEPPVFHVSGEGIVSQIGEVWRIGGLDFAVTDEIVIKGNPQVGDLVSVKGHLEQDGTRVADQIELKRRAPENRFAFTGAVESIGETEWEVAGRTVAVNAETRIDDGIEAGDRVRVDGVIESDGTLLALHIHLDAGEAGLPFEFVGVVETMGEDAWTISGATVAISDTTHIQSGIDVGDVVKAKGRILEDGTWLAKAIDLTKKDAPEFEFVGTVDSLDPWLVSGIALTTDDDTEIEDGIEAGDIVKVEGRILEDGTRLATEIKRVEDDDDRAHFEIVGRVDGIDPWLIGGTPIAVDDQTRIDDGIEVGDLVRVKGRILEDGTLLAESIRRLRRHPMCMELRAVVTAIDGNRIQLSNGHTIEITAQTEVTGEIEVGSVVAVILCEGEDGRLVVVRVKVIRAKEPPEPTPEPGDRVTICHIPPGNPGNAHTLTVDASAVPAHLAHGDTLGPCGDGEDRNDDQDHHDDATDDDKHGGKHDDGKGKDKDKDTDKDKGRRKNGR